MSSTRDSLCGLEIVLLVSILTFAVLLAPTAAASRAQTTPIAASMGTSEPSPSSEPTPDAMGAGTPGPRVQYLLTMSANFGTVSPGNGWYDAGTVVPIIATPPPGSALERYQFQNWTGDYNGTSPSGSITMDGPKTVHAVWVHQFRNNIQSNSAGQSIVVDGTATPTPATVWWAEGTTHILTAPRNVALGADTRLNFAFWSPGGSTNIVYTISSVSSSVTYTATFTRQFRVTVVTSPGTGPFVLVDGVPYTVPVWFDDGTTHAFDAGSTPQSTGFGTRYAFRTWDTGSTTTLRAFTTMGPMVMTATFDTEYQLTVTSQYGNPACIGANLNGCWYLAGTQATASVTSPFVAPDGTRYEIAGWSGDATGTGSSVSVIMDGPKSVTAEWRQVLLFLEIPSPLGLTVLLAGVGIAVLAGLVTGLILRQRRKARPPSMWPGYPPR